MKQQPLSRQLVGGILVLLTLLGCGVFSRITPTAVPSATFTPTTPATPTAIPTATPRPTETPLPGPRPGVWSGAGVTFTVTKGGQVKDFKLSFDFADVKCTYQTFNSVPIEDNAFLISETTTNQGFVNLFGTDETMNIAGNFVEDTSLSGTWSARMCAEQISFTIEADGSAGPITGEWNASWQDEAADSASEVCPYAGANDAQTFTNLIRAEEQSMLKEDMNIVRTIYADGATLTDVSQNQTWTNVIEHYQGLFDELDFKKLNHYDIEVVRNDGNKAWVKATDSGVLIMASDGQEVEYQNDPGTNHYIFEKDSAGCWLISHFSKAAASERFP